MNFHIIKRTIGWLLLFEAMFFLVPIITAIVYSEREIVSFLVTMSICIALGLVCLLGKPKSEYMYAKEGLVIVSLSWIVISIFGALPFWLSGAIPSFVDALFETVSGFTTTGATIIATGAQVAALPKCMLMWRSFTHWVGGMGVLVLIMAFLPLSGARNMHIMRAESPGPTVDKLVPRVKTTAKVLYSIYLVMTLLEFIMLLCGGMSCFEALSCAFSTAGTGGFSWNAEGMGVYSSYLQVVVTVFMILFSINFNSYYLVLRGKIKDAFSTEVRAFLIITILAISAIAINIYLTSGDLYNYSIGEAIKHSAFSVGSIISTTGFTTENFDLWPAFSKAILVILMFIGACAGSTGGGIKVSRWLILGKGVIYELKMMLHPKQVRKISIDKRPVESETVRAVSSYLVAYILIYIASMLIVSLDCPDLETNFTAVAATINNVGPGLSAVGPAGSYAFFSDVSKLVFVFDMLVGRLEVFPMLLLFTPATWKKQ
ncbi:MAG: TrkH family potassium uptake protein [Ruminococcaceae bacterium]|nr:TrkH family potassium uptake protein [Oscillospiraceae bacterium]